MNTTDYESSITSGKAQETANASSTYTIAPINCQAATGPTSSDVSAENDSPTNTHSSCSSNSQGALKIFAPVITHDVTLPNTAKKVPMVMVPVPESRTLMAIPMSTLSQFKDSQMNTLKDEQQARDLLIWNEGIGTLDGCDLRFKLNQLGCLELLDSDDESENQNLPKHNAISTNTQTTQNSDEVTNIVRQLNGIVSDSLTNINSNTTNITTSSTTTITNTSTMTTNTSSTNNHTITNTTTSNTTNTNSIEESERALKRAKLDTEQASVRQISPGSSLLRDGPNIRRPKSSSSSSLSSSTRSQANSLSLLKKLENNQNSILLDKLVPKQKLDKIKTNVEKWTIEDVKKFVDSIPGCSGHGELFESQQICGKSLMYLDQRDLLDVINVKLGPAVKIYHAISLLK